MHTKYYIEDLMTTSNKAIVEFDGSCSGIQRRHVFDDITYIKREQDWCAPMSSVRINVMPNKELIALLSLGCDVTVIYSSSKTADLQYLEEMNNYEIVQNDRTE